MGVMLAKGGNVNLSKEDPNLNNISVGLGWNVRETNGASFDLDACGFLLAANGRVRSDSDFVFYNSLVSPCGSVKHEGDNRTGAGDGDDEVIKVTLNKVPAGVEKVVFTVTIHDGEAKRQNFGQVGQAYIRVVNDDTGNEVARYDLSEDASNVTSMIFGELYRHNGDWKFKAIGHGFNKDLGALVANYGVSVG